MLKEKNCEQVNESDIPGPILRILTQPLAWGWELVTTTDRRFFKVENKITNGRCEYMLLPNDTTRYYTIISNSDWLFKREPSWEAIKYMSPEEIESKVSEIIIRYMRINRPLVYFGITQSINGTRGLDIAIEVFNWTALEYEDALTHTARQLWTMLVNEEVRRLENDTWVLDIHDKLFQFVRADAEKMPYYNRIYHDRLYYGGSYSTRKSAL